MSLWGFVLQRTYVQIKIRKEQLQGTRGRLDRLQNKNRFFGPWENGPRLNMPLKAAGCVVVETSEKK